MATSVRHAKLRSAIVTVIVLAVGASSVLAQSVPAGSPRVRITASDAYELPGVLSIHGDRVTGSLVTSDDAMVQVRLPQTNELVTVPLPGKRLVGLLTSIDTEAAWLTLTEQSAPLRIPLDAIKRIEISEGRQHGLATAVLAGVGAGYGVGVLVALTARLDSAWQVVGLFAVAAAGVGVGHALRREHWKDTTAASLRESLGRSSRTAFALRGPE